MLLVEVQASAGQWLRDGVEMTEKVHSNATRPWFKKPGFILSLSLVVFLVIVLAVNATRGRGSAIPATGDSQSKAERSTQVEAPVAGIGTKVRDGTFEFVVTGVDRPGKMLVGKVGEMLTAHGEFVVVRVNVTNVGNKAQSPDGSCQLLHNENGREFEPSSSILRTTGALKFVRQIDPGETVEDVLVLFDVAPGTKVVNVELHESPFSPGVQVKLS